MALTRRSRVLPTDIPSARLYTHYFHPDPSVGRVDFVSESPGRTYNAYQVTDSMGHPWRNRKRFPGRDIGGDFFTRKRYFVPKTGGVAFESGKTGSVPVDYEVTFRGPLYAIDPGPGVPLSVPSNIGPTVAALDIFGAQAVALSKPTNSVADASTFLGELMREGLPSLVGVNTWKGRTGQAREAGKDYLSYEFGWKPLISEINKFAEGIAFAERILAQYERDAGKLVRRRFVFPTTVTTTTTTAGARTPFPVPGSAFGISGGVSSGIITVRKVEQRRWFSGAFTYHLPYDYHGRLRMGQNALMAKTVLGLDPSPDTVWNLAPWTWAIDWFSNAGDVVNNLSDWATDGLVMQYGYLMEHTIITNTTTQTVNRLKGSPSIAPVIIVEETKMRRRANPFGFGVSWDGLTTRQAAIASALGLSKFG